MPTATLLPESDLDPTSASLDYDVWLRNRYAKDDNSGVRASHASVAFQSLNVYGYGSATDYQKTFANYPGAILRDTIAWFARRGATKIHILDDFEGVVQNGEMLLVLGRPGSGCSTFLRTLAGQTRGLQVDKASILNYQGISARTMHSEFRGECTYHAESDFHIAHLTVSETLQLSSKARTSHDELEDSGKSWKSYAAETQNATLSALNLSSVVDTKIGNTFIQGISGGERKRAGIAEIMVGGSPFQCWDNSTRGLDSANALEFLRALRQSTTIRQSVSLVSLYQASQDMYDIFDKVILLYEGQEIFFGPVAEAKEYFVKLGFVCPERSTTADFLTSLTNPAARMAKSGTQAWSSRNPEDFAQVWKLSAERAQLQKDIADYDEKFSFKSDQLAEYRAVRKAQKSPHMRQGSPYTVSLSKQIHVCIVRSLQRLRNDLQTPLSAIGGNFMVSIILGSMFYNMPDTTDSFFGRGVLLFFTILLNTYSGAFEGVGLWETRPVVEKHFSLALYHPTVESIASILCDIPNKFLLTFAFNIPFYFLANLRRTPAAFFTFYLFAFTSLVAGSMLFRTIGAMSRTLTTSIAPGAVFVYALTIYTGFVLPIPYMHPWFSWFRYINPVTYAFESLMANEFKGREFKCPEFIPSGPSYKDVGPENHACNAAGAAFGSSVVDGTTYITNSTNGGMYLYSHMNVQANVYINLGVIICMGTFLCGLYLAASEWIPLQGSKGEVLIFPQGHFSLKTASKDEESQTPNEKPLQIIETATDEAEPTPIEGHGKSIQFLWDNLTYDIPTSQGPKRVLHGIQGWVRQGSLSAVMGPSGAGKTTLLNVLADRAPGGIVGGEIVKGDQDDNKHSFARKVGYAQQADIHLSTSTVREALEFSVTLRQSEEYSIQERLAYVKEVIELLDMGSFVDAVIGVPGEGLNVERRKKVTIGVELAVRPELLLFLDEPTSGLDSNTAWAICTLLKKLSQNGQAILCTIHQPSGELFQMFNKLLLLSEDGKQTYFGDVDPKCETVIKYFETQGGRSCLEEENPAGWLLEVTKASSDHTKSWADKWAAAEERKEIEHLISETKKSLQDHPAPQTSSPIGRTEFARSFWTQLWILTKRNLLRDWRTPSYLYSKSALVIAAGLVNGFSFYHSTNTLQGIQNQIFAIFLLLTLFSNVVQLIMPQYIENRDLYEIRERPSKVYSWPAFVLSNTIAELPWQTLLSVVLYAVWYYPVGMNSNIPAGEVNERAGLQFLFIWSFMIFTSTFSQLVVTPLPGAALGVNIASLLYSLSLIFCGVLVSPAKLPRFWIWMLRVTPLTYFVSGMASTGLGRLPLTCSPNEFLHFNPLVGQDCGTYLKEYMSYAGGSLLNLTAQQNCEFCPLSDVDAVLKSLGIYYEDRWRNFGITMVYSVVNVLGALGLYWAFRLPKRTKG